MILSVKWNLQDSRLAVILNVAPNLARHFRNMSVSVMIAKSAYFLLESMIVEGVFKSNVSKKVAHGCEHTFAKHGTYDV